MTAKDDKSFYYSNSLIMKARPSDASEDYWLVFNKMKKTEVFKLDKQLYRYTCPSVNCIESEILPKFVDQMNDRLFAQIDGVVDFDFRERNGGKSGWLLLFNINGRPMTCFTWEGEDISKEVRHEVLLFF